MSETPMVLEASQPKFVQELLCRSRARAVGSELETKRAEFENIYCQLPEIGQRLLIEYQKIMAQFGLDPGEVRLYMVGGRVQGKPLSKDSDIDLIFAVENVGQSPGASVPDGGWGPLEAQDKKSDMCDDIRARLSEICNRLGIPNHFHILGYGSSLPLNDIDTTQRLLLATLLPQQEEQGKPFV